MVNKPYIHVTDNGNEFLISEFVMKKLNNSYFLVVLLCINLHCPDKNDFDANTEIYPNYFGVGWTKVYIEKMCQFYSRISKTKFTVIRHSNIWRA